MKTVATWVIIAFIVIGVLLAIIIKKIVGKIISLVLAAVIVFFAWQQRDKVEDYANEVRGKVCTAEPSFFGINVDLPESWCDDAAG